MYIIFTVPRPTVQVTSVDTLEFGEVTTLECNVAAVRGITSRVDIIWTSRFTTVRRVNGVTASIVNNSASIGNNSAVYTDRFITAPLSVSDNGRVYQCQVIINSNFIVSASSSITLDFLGKKRMYCLYIL